MSITASALIRWYITQATSKIASRSPRPLWEAPQVGVALGYPWAVAPTAKGDPEISDRSSPSPRLRRATEIFKPLTAVESTAKGDWNCELKFLTAHSSRIDCEGDWNCERCPMQKFRDYTRFQGFVITLRHVTLSLSLSSLFSPSI